MSDQPVYIDFHPEIAPSIPTKKTRGLLVGLYLVISSLDTKPITHAIYNTQGKRIIKKSFQKFESAKKVAEWIDEKYNEFFYLWEEYPDADIFTLAQHTIEHGEVYLDLLKKDGMV